MKTRVRFLICILIVLTLAACAPQVVDEITDPPDDALRENWPDFPPIEYHWVVDEAGCFSQESIEIADEIFQKLQDENLIEIGVVCINGVGEDYLKWLTEWGNFVGVGLKESGRGIVWLIRPDVEPEQHRITYHTNDESWQTTAIDTSPIKRQAVNFCNWNNYDGCLETLAHMMDEYIRSENRLEE
jgi:hypothetical protein